MKHIRLWVDDERPMPSDFTHHAKTAADAIRILTSQIVEYISLDHDLGPEHAGNGYEIASWIEFRAYSKTLRRISWAVHSANPIGRARMIVALKNADKFWNKF